MCGVYMYAAAVCSGTSVSAYNGGPLVILTVCGGYGGFGVRSGSGGDDGNDDI